MAKAKQSLRAATEKAVSANAGYRAVIEIHFREINMSIPIRLVIAAAFVTALSLSGIACERGEGSEKSPNKTAVAEARITEEEAKAAAIRAVPGSVQSVRLETEEGKAVYEVMIQPEASGNATQAAPAPTNVLVDANAGNVVKTEPAGKNDDDDDDD